MNWLYGLFLTVSVGGLLIIDWRYSLAFFRNHLRVWRVLLFAVLFFIVWDVLGIVLGIFFIGDTQYLSGIKIGEFPIEELGFLFLLNYTSLLMYLALKRRGGQQ